MTKNPTPFDTSAKSAGDTVRRLQESRVFVHKLSQTEIFRDYEQAFGMASGLPLAIRPIETFNIVLQGKTNANPFCSIMARSNQGCAACLEMQRSLEESAGIAPKTLRCFAGLCDSAVPIRVGDNLVAFLQTGQVLLHQPSKAEFDRIARTLIKWSAQVDLKRLEEAYFQTRVLTTEQYEAFVNLLATFAQHLAMIANDLMVRETASEPEAVSTARQFIEANCTDSITLAEAARKVNTSAHYFCKMFKKATGLTFTEYLTRLRVEKAKNLLLNPNKRVSETAFEVGFESLSQFNRAFKRVAGVTPTKFRTG